MISREALIAWAAVAVVVLLCAIVITARIVGTAPRPARAVPRRDDGGTADQARTAPATELYPGIPDTHLLCTCPMVDAPGGAIPLRDWLKHLAGADAWSVVVSRFYARASSDPEIAAYFTDVDMPQLQRHFLAAIMIVTGQGVTAGVVRRMREAHTEVRDSRAVPITGEIWDAVVAILVGVLSEMHTPPATLVALGSTIAPLRAAIVVEPETSAPGA